MDVCEIPKEQLGRGTVLAYKSYFPLRLKVNCKVIHVLMQSSLYMLDFEEIKARKEIKVRKAFIFDTILKQLHNIFENSLLLGLSFSYHRYDSRNP